MIGLLSLVEELTTDEICEELEAFIPYGPHYIPRETALHRHGLRRSTYS